MFINEDSSWGVVPIIFSLMVLALSFLSTIFAKKIIAIGKKIENIYLRIGYYIILPFFLLAICFGVYALVLYIDENFITTPNQLASALSQAFYLLLIVAVVSIMVILPYIQAIIINILNAVMKKQ